MIPGISAYARELRRAHAPPQRAVGARYVCAWYPFFSAGTSTKPSDNTVSTDLAAHAVTNVAAQGWRGAAGILSYGDCLRALGWVWRASSSC